MKYKIIFLISMLLFALALIIAQGCTGDSCTNTFQNFGGFGQGVLFDNQRNQLTNQPTNQEGQPNSPATPDQILQDFDAFTNQFQDSANKFQQKEVDSQRMQQQFGTQVEGDPSKGQWSADGQQFNYNGVEFDEQSKCQGGSCPQTQFNPDGSVDFQGQEGGNMNLKSDTGQTAFKPETGGAGSYGGDGGTGSAPAGGGTTASANPGQAAAQGANQQMQEVSQAMGIVQQFLGLFQGFADKLAKTSDEGTAKITTPNQYGGLSASIDDTTLAYMNSQNQVELFAKAQAKTGEVNTKTTAKEITAKNVDLTVPEQAHLTIPEQETTIRLNGIKGNDPNFREATNTAAINSITGQAIINGEEVDLSQYIQFQNHDLAIGGKELTVYTLKTFNNVDAAGQDINVISGDVAIKFQGQKILYPRLVKNAPYGIKKITNQLDKENQYQLQHFTNKDSLLTDYQGIASVGDIFSTHPKIPGLVIAKIRNDMWKTN